MNCVETDWTAGHAGVFGFFYFMQCDEAAQNLIKDNGMVSSEIFLIRSF